MRNCLPIILDHVPECMLMVVGDDPSGALVHRGGEMSLIRNTVAELGLQKNVVFVGRVDDRELMGIYRAVDLFIFPVIEVPNDVEGFGMVAIEAALAEKPSVGSRIGGIPDAVEDGIGGVLVPPGDYPAFAGAVVDLLKNEKKRKSMGMRARHRVLSRFTWDHLTGEWNALVDRILEGREPS